MRLRTKLLLAQAPLVLALVVLAAVGGLITRSLGRQSRDILSDNYRSVLAAQRMKEAIERMDSGALFIVAGERAEGVAQAREFRAQFDDELRVQEANISEAGEREATARLRRAWDAYRARYDAFQHLADAGALREAYFGLVLPAFREVKAAAGEVLAMNQDAMVRKSDAASRTAAWFWNVLLSVAVGACVLGIWASTRLTERLLRPLTVLTHAARRLGEGDMEARARLPGGDELAALASEFNTMADRLQTYRRSTLGELLEAQRASQAAIDSLPDPVVVLSLGGGLLHVNRAAEALLRVDVETGLDRAEPVVREVLDRMRRHVQAGRGAYVPRGLEEAFAVATPEGERRLLPRAAPLLAEEGDVTGATVVLQDVTRLTRFDELKNDLVATVAHEIRTPLTSLRMALHLLAEQAVGPLSDKQGDLVFAARDDCERLQSTVDELLDLSRIQSGRIALSLAPVDAEALAREAVDERRDTAAQAGVVLRCEVLPGSGAVLVDRERVRHVFDNLIANAVRHSPRDGEVVVRARATGERLRFEVADQGPGIAPEHRELVFARHVRLPGAAAGGAGLGLFIAREIVQAHDGEIGVDSEPGRGSTFWFTLPMA